MGKFPSGLSNPRTPLVSSPHVQRPSSTNLCQAAGCAIQECGNRKIASSCPRPRPSRTFSPNLHAARGLRANATCSIGGNSRSASMVDISCSATCSERRGAGVLGFFTLVIQSAIPFTSRIV